VEVPPNIQQNFQLCDIGGVGELEPLLLSAVRPVARAF
jgi:hypothetical protein